MSREQLPENKGGRPPPSSEDVWQIKEGEMTPQESRTLGHLLYAGIFTAVSPPVYAVLYQEFVERECEERGHEEHEEQEQFDARAVSADRYIEKYAQVYGLSAEVLKRWTHQASTDLAHATIPVLLQERDRLATVEWWSEAQAQEYTQDVIEPIIEVAQQGIATFVEYHIQLVGEAYYMDRDLGESVPLNSSHIRGIFDNRLMCVIRRDSFNEKL